MLREDDRLGRGKEAGKRREENERFLRFIPIYINDESMTEYGRQDVLTTCHGLPSRENLHDLGLYDR